MAYRDENKKATPGGTLGGAIFTGVCLLVVSSANAQNLFVSDYGSYVYGITPAGVQNTFATGMDYPFGIAFNSSGDLFVANCNNNAPGGYITEITPDGQQSTFATGINADALAVDGAGNVFAADYRSGIIYEYTPDGQQSTFATGFHNVISMAFNSAGDLFVGGGYGNGNGTITEITPGGTQKLFDSGLSFPGGLAFDSAGTLFVSSQVSGTIYEYILGGFRITYKTLPTTAINGMAFDNAGNFYAAEPETGKIIKITPGGVQSTFANIPTGLVSQLAFQPDDVLYLPLKISARASYDIGGKKKTANITEAEIISALNLPIKTTLAVATDTGDVWAVDATTGDLTEDLTGGGYLTINNDQTGSTTKGTTTTLTGPVEVGIYSSPVFVSGVLIRQKAKPLPAYGLNSAVPLRSRKPRAPSKPTAIAQRIWTAMNITPSLLI